MESLHPEVPHNQRGVGDVVSVMGVERLGRIAQEGLVVAIGIPAQEVTKHGDPQG